MRHTYLTSILVTMGTAALLSAPAQAGHGFDTTITAPVQTTVKLDVQLSDEMAYRANNLPKSLRDRGGVGLSRSGFSANGYYGEKDLNRLTARLEKRLNEQLAKRGVTVDDNASTVLRVVLTDVRNNRPTFKQLSKEPGLSYDSFGNGGAEIEAELIRAGGEALGEMSYQWYENDIQDARFGGTWSDANRTIDRFAKKAAKTLGTS
ncbi:DUF3313 family protein [Fretibacter rubidus]|uniref:DUF3313 family protein n=1 Tax=Fretibacter rubidus TaxID=570162 RepID=UPI00352BC801